MIYLLPLFEYLIFRFLVVHFVVIALRLFGRSQMNHSRVCILMTLRLYSHKAAFMIYECTLLFVHAEEGIAYFCDVLLLNIK